MSFHNLTTKIQPDFIPPSDEIQSLFTFAKNVSLNEDTHKNDSIYLTSSVSSSSKSTPIHGLEDYLFSEEEFAKMPSTLMKAVKRTKFLLDQTDAARKAAIETNNELKSIHSLIVRYAKKTLKELDRSEQIEKPTEKATPKGFRRQCKISDEMCAFIGVEPGSMSSRVDVNKAINAYVKNHGLVEKNNAQCILPDEKLSALLSEDAKGNKITYFSIQKYIKHHYIK